MAAGHAHRRPLTRWLASTPPVEPEQPAQPLYPFHNLVLHVDTSIGAAGVTLNGNGQVTAWKNQVAGGAHFVPDAPLDYYPDGSTYAVDCRKGTLLATLPQTYASPATIFLLLKVLPNTPYSEYQLPIELSNTANADVLRGFVKQSTNVLVYDGNSYMDLSGQYPINSYCIVSYTTSGDGEYYTGGFNIRSPGISGGGYGGFYYNRSFNRIACAVGNYLLKLYLVYNRRLTEQETAEVVATMQQRFTLFQ
ncbi:hypothetical protein [Hymenobacter defluvii]|uniref:Uncharacterized protein n=1 Tax=Hymenobacter defluvii TaxID=2054411 RepID=A0ABS3TAU6_9BACT|nr:hypothetical protein [Hymenobacter defluvii]MBO3270766.1 hypothetical protein [Hymenobacter defluvii]